MNIKILMGMSSYFLSTLPKFNSHKLDRRGQKWTEMDKCVH